MSPQLVIVGHIINERIEFPDKVVCPVLGSPAAYSSVAAARLGIPTGLVTRVGTDFPSELLKPFRDAGVDLSGLIQEGNESTVNRLIYDRAGNKSVAYLSKAPDIEPQDFPPDFVGCELIYVCPMDYEVPIRTVRALRQLGATMAVDLGGFGGATSDSHPDALPGEGLAWLAELVSYFNIVKASAEDSRYFFGDVTGREEWVATQFVEWGADVGMVTLGARGVAVATRNSTWIVPGYPAKSVDATGAGDTYSAGFLAEYLRTRHVGRSARFGCATASLVIERSGGVVVPRMPTSNMVEARMRGGASLAEVVMCGSKVLLDESEAIAHLAESIGGEFSSAVELIMSARGRVAVTGVGKSGRIGEKIAASLSSLGTPAFFVHACEAVHGDSGMLTRDDVVIAISHSGETREVLDLMPLVKDIGCKVISITKSHDNSLARMADVSLTTEVQREADPLGLAPTTSATVTLALGDALAIALARVKGFSREDFARFHPGGTLGRQLSERMATSAQIRCRNAP